jgi:hypothetical protein
MDLGTGPVKDFRTHIKVEIASLKEDQRLPTLTPLEEGLQHDKFSNIYYPNVLPDYILAEENRPQHYKPDIVRAVGFKVDENGILIPDTTYTGRLILQLIECKYSTDSNMQTVIDHIHTLYEPLRQQLLMHATGMYKADIQVIPIVISRTGSFHVKTRAEIAKLVSFQEEQPDTLKYKQMTQPAQEIAMALHVHAQEWLSLISKISRGLLARKTAHLNPT